MGCLYLCVEVFVIFLARGDPDFVGVERVWSGPHGRTRGGGFFGGGQVCGCWNV